MFIKEDTKLLNNAYKCNKRIGEYLSKRGFPTLSKTTDGEFFYFSKTDKLLQEIDNLPLWLKIFK